MQVELTQAIEVLIAAVKGLSGTIDSQKQTFDALVKKVEAKNAAILELADALKMMLSHMNGISCAAIKAIESEVPHE